MAAAPLTFADVLRRRLGHGAGQPLLTWYDARTGERVELSVTTYANWVAKAASLLVHEHDLERGATLRVDLPPHWLGPVFLGAAWSAGLVVAFAGDADAVVCGPATVATWAEQARDIPVLACSLLPMGARFAEALPDGVHDVGVDVWSQPDAFVASDPPGPDDPAVVVDEQPTTQRAMWEAAAAGSLVTDGGRLLTEANPASPPGLATFAEPLRRSGSVVYVSHAGAAELREIASAERVTVVS